MDALAAARASRARLIEDLTAYVALETPSDDPEALASGLAWARAYVTRHLGEPDGADVTAGAPYGDTAVLRYAASNDGAGAIGVLCHYDTVWPLGTLREWPVSIDGDRFTGPGAFDMKAGLVQFVHAVRIAREHGMRVPALTIVLNGDEEVGSPASRPVIEDAVRGLDAVLVFEASADGAVKTARKGVGLFSVTTTGREAHAGLDPDRGISAIDEIARAVLQLHGAADRAAGTSVNVGILSGGSRMNVTAGRAEAHIDVRVESESERERIDAVLAGLRAEHPDATLTVSGGWNRPIMPRSDSTAALFTEASEAADELGFSLTEISVGGASDGNFAAALGIPVLDGLGAVGDGAHARTEWVSIDGMVERTALAAALLHRLGQG